MKTLSWVAIACNSHDRTPMNAYFGASSVSGLISNPVSVRRALNSRCLGGNRNFFQECGPTA